MRNCFFHSFFASRHHYAALLKYSLYLTKNKVDASDLLHGVLLKLLSQECNANFQNDEEYVLAYIKKAIRWAYLDSRRKKIPIPILQGEMEILLKSQELVQKPAFPSAIIDELSYHVKLSKSDLELLEFIIAGYTPKEIADFLGKKPGCISSQKCTLKKKILHSLPTIENMKVVLF